MHVRIKNLRWGIYFPYHFFITFARNKRKRAEELMLKLKQLTHYFLFA